MDYTEYLQKEKIGKLLLAFSVPSILSMVLNALYNTVDQIFIGQGVGYLGNGATNVIFPLTQLAVAVGLLIGDGAAAYINLQLGQGKKENADKGMAAGIVGMLVAGIVLFAVYNIFLEPLCHLFGATELTLPYALEYGRIISIGIIFCVFASGSMSMVRADGSPKVAMIGMVAGCVVNLIGDPIAIFVLKQGVAGAAWATILGQLVNMIINMLYLRKCKSVTVTRKELKGCRAYIPRVSKMGMSSFVTQISVVIVVAVMNNLMVAYGAASKYGAEIPMTALGITMKVFTILQFAIIGLCAGAQPVISCNYGSGCYQRVSRLLKIILVISIGIMAVATIWFQIAPMSIVNIFGSSDDLYNEFAVKCMKIYLMLLVFDAVQMTASSFLQSIGKSVKAALITLIRQIVILVPAACIFAKAFGVEGILYSGPVAALVSGILSAVFLAKENGRLKEGKIEKTEGIPVCE